MCPVVLQSAHKSVIMPRKITFLRGGSGCNVRINYLNNSEDRMCFASLPTQALILAIARALRATLDVVWSK